MLCGKEGSRNEEFLVTVKLWGDGFWRLFWVVM